MESQKNSQVATPTLAQPDHYFLFRKRKIDGIPQYHQALKDFRKRLNDLHSACE